MKKQLALVVALTMACGFLGTATANSQTYTNSLGMTFKFIPAGTFMMGSPEDELARDPDETLNQVTISNSYYLQTTEVTQAQWEAVMGSNPSNFSCPGCPVESVTWYDVQDFITGLNDMGEGTYRLPTEAEWEYAARAGSTTAFANGGITETRCGYDPNLDQMGWYCYNSGDQTHLVAQKTPNAWGLYDMHGNVWEWCQDWYGDYPTASVADPQGPSSGTYRVLRGGSWTEDAWLLRSANRGGGIPDDLDSDDGFRVALSISVPTANTGPATSVTSTSATLNGTVDPNVDGTTYYKFEYNTTPSGYYGTPLQEITGLSTVSAIATLTDLSPSTTYYYRLTATNYLGTSYGTVETFTTQSPPASEPTVFTGSATSVTSTSATMTGSVNPNGTDTTYYFEYGLTTSYGSTTASTSGGSGTNDISVSATVDGLSPVTLYHYRLVAENSDGTTNGSDSTFTTSAPPASPPSVSTGAATLVTSSSATINGTVNPNGEDTTYYFEYGTSTAYGLTTANISAGSGTSDVSATANLTGLNPDITYHFRLVATNSIGTSYGANLTFTTSTSIAPPMAITGPATSLTFDFASLSGTVNPNGDGTIYYFEYGTSTDYGSASVSLNAGSGTINVPASVNITGLDPNTTYHYRLVAINSAGTSYGSDGILTTPEAPPPVVEIGYLVTEELWIRAVIDTEEKGPIEAVWQVGGQDTTSAEDLVIWGYFYASPEDVTWGSIDNPDLYVKIWFDHGGRVDVNFFHVSVPNIEVYSDYFFDNSPDEQGATTMTTRYIRQYYEDGESFSQEQDEDGDPPEDYTPGGDPSGYVTINDLRIGAMINTVERGPIEAVWRIGGQDSTDRGDQVVWGHFYASPEDVTWGSPNNPDLFVKIWFDASGRIDVNYFHVSVPDIEVYSDFPEDGYYEDAGTTIMDNRYIRHEFFMPGDCTDDDGDGYGVGTGCQGPDCDDDNPDIHPGATETCGDRIDNDCDLLVDDECEVAK